MSGVDEEFLRKLRATFELEAGDHLQVIASNLVALEVGSGATTFPQRIEMVFRSAHSLKGAARAVGFVDVEAICQALENLFADWRRGSAPPSADALDMAHQLLDQITTVLYPGRPDSAPSGPLADSGERGFPGEGGRAPAASQPAGSDSGRPPSGATVRIAVDTLDERLLEAEELVSTKLTASQRAAELLAIEEQLGVWRHEWERVQPHVRALRRNAASPALADFFDWSQDYLRLLENRTATQRQAAARDHAATARRIDSLLASSKKMLMLPLGTLTGWLPKTVRDLCRDQGKVAEVQMQGEDVEIDKRILEEIKDPLIHLLRNCVDHGIESPEQRRALGKAPQATISLDISTVDSGQVEIAVRDDGRGIDIAALKSAAVAQQLIPAAQVGELADHDALQLIFLPDFSTRSVVTRLSGRGLGLAIVRENAERLGGGVSVETWPGKGTLFRIRLPVTLATFRGLVVEVAERRYVLRVTDVERALRYRQQDVRTVEGRETLRVGGRVVPLVSLAQVLQIRGLARPTEFVPAVLLGNGPQSVVFAVDAVLDEQEVLVKQLGRPLHRLQHIAGATVLGSGELAPILKAADLLRYASHVRAPVQVAAPAEPSGRQAATRILVAEDSSTSRILMEAILEGAGYQVQTAVDGMEAYTLLCAERFDLLVSDVEMPRLDGFGLTARIRADKALSDLPVILVTALGSQEDRQRGIKAGANAYLVKSSFGQSNLLEAIRRLI